IRGVRDWFGELRALADDPARFAGLALEALKAGVAEGEIYQLADEYFDNGKARIAALLAQEAEAAICEAQVERSERKRRDREQALKAGASKAPLKAPELDKATRISLAGSGWVGQSLRQRQQQRRNEVG